MRADRSSDTGDGKDLRVGLENVVCVEGRAHSCWGTKASAGNTHRERGCKTACPPREGLCAEGQSQSTWRNPAGGKLDA